MEPFPIGRLIAVVVFGWCAVISLVPLRRPRPLAVLSWLSAMAPNEIPMIYAIVLAAPTVGALVSGTVDTGVEWAVVTAVAVVVALYGLVAARGARARRTVESALVGVDVPGARISRRPLGRALRESLAPLPLRPRSIEKVRNIAYGPSPVQRLDLYLPRSRDSIGTLIHLHGGRFRSGGRSREARSLMYRLASNGWACISADYHLSRTPIDGFPKHLVDVKRVLAWVRCEGPVHGVDPDTVVLSGSSAGAHLTVMAALTAGDERLQPGFEHADTHIDAGVGLYGYYGALGEDRGDVPTSPLERLRPDAPPLMIVHGTNDTYTPIEGAGSLVNGLRATSEAPVVYAELPGAQHSFDVFASLRFESVVDGIERFARSVLDGSAVARSSSERV